MDLIFTHRYATNTSKSSEFNGLGTFTNGLILAGENTQEYRAFPLSFLPWKFRKIGMNAILELERIDPEIKRRRLDLAFENWMKWLDGKSFDAFFCRELFSFSLEQLEQVAAKFTFRTIWLSWSPGRVHSSDYKKYLKYFTHIFLIDREGVDKLRKEGFNAFYLPLALSDFCINSQRPKKTYDVGFIGTIYPNRMQLLNVIPRALLSFWSSNFEADTAVMYPELKGCYRGSVWGQAMLRKMGSIKILINPVHRSYMLGSTDNVTNFRNFESLGEFTFQISEHKDAIREIFDEDEVATYTCLDDLNSKIEFYLDNPELRYKMVEKARTKVLDKHLYSHRMAELARIVRDS